MESKELLQKKLGKFSVNQLVSKLDRGCSEPEKKIAIEILAKRGQDTSKWAPVIAKEVFVNEDVVLTEEEKVQIAAAEKKFDAESTKTEEVEKTTKTPKVAKIEKVEGGSLQGYVKNFQDKVLTEEEIKSLKTKREKVIACWFSGIKDAKKISEIADYAVANVRGIIHLSGLK